MTNFSSLWNKYKFLFMYNSNSTWTTSCSVTFCYCLSEAVKLWFPTGSNSQQEVIPSKSRTFPPPSVTRAVGLFSVFSRDGNFMNKMLGGFCAHNSCSFRGPVFSLSLCRVWGLAFTANRMTPCLKDTQVIHVHPIEYWFLLIFNDTQMIHPIDWGLSLTGQVVTLLCCCI